MSSYNKYQESSARFYAALPLGTLDTFARLSGLETGIDVDCLYREGFLHKEESVLELGAGYGRVLHALLERGHAGKISALERNLQFFRFLQEHYPAVPLYVTDLLSGDLPSADVGLWMWSGIMEFSPREQQQVLFQLASAVHKVAIDTPAVGAVSNATSTDGQHQEVSTGWGVIQTYLPTSSEISSFAQLAGFSFRMFPYQTTTQRHRVLYLLSRSPLP